MPFCSLSLLLKMPIGSDTVSRYSNKPARRFRFGEPSDIVAQLSKLMADRCEKHGGYFETVAMTRKMDMRISFVKSELTVSCSAIAKTCMAQPFILSLRVGWSVRFSWPSNGSFDDFCGWSNGTDFRYADPFRQSSVSSACPAVFSVGGKIDRMKAFVGNAVPLVAKVTRQICSVGSHPSPN